MHCKESEPTKCIIVQLSCTFEVSEGYIYHKHRESFSFKIQFLKILKTNPKNQVRTNVYLLTSSVSKKGNFKAAHKFFGYNLSVSLTYLTHKKETNENCLVWGSL